MDRMESLSKERLRELHRPRWSGTWAWMGFGVAFVLLEGALLALLLVGPPGVWGWAAGGVLVLLLAHVMHGHLIAFHEAAHGSLCPVRWLNDFFGLHISAFNLMSLALYRAAHHSHHAWLATLRDEELWPFVDPRAPRGARRLAALLELSAGLFYTPLLFFRAFLRRGSAIRGRAVRRRIWVEQAVILLAGSAGLAAVAWWEVWRFWLVMYFVPAFLAANMQSLRKYIEHMGMTGTTALGATRSVVPAGWLGRLISVSLYHEPYHGAHHRYARLPQGALPAAAPLLTPEAEGELPPFSSYRRALWHMLGTLADPRVGPQWLAAAPATEQPAHLP
jgi:fatty acid desaturase